MNKHFPRRRARQPTQAQRQEAAENYRSLKAQRAFYIDLVENFPKYLAALDAKVTAAEVDRLTLIAKHAQAPAKIAECDCRINAMETVKRHLTR